jgi:hypothetical protein
MGNKTRLAALLCIVSFLVSASIFVQAYTLDSIAKPSAPKFTVKIASHPYEVQPVTSTTTDQYTGKQTTTTTPGYQVENKSIEVTIKNPTFTPHNYTSTTAINHETQETYQYTHENTIDLFYTVNVKGHFGYDTDWKTYGSDSYSYYEGPKSNVQYGSEYTVITIKADNFPAESVLDFRVKALEGYYLPWGESIMVLGYDFYGQESDWSNIQVLTLGEVGTTAVPIDAFTATTPQPTQTATPTQAPTNETPQPSTVGTDQSLLQGTVAFGLTWQNFAIVILCVIVAGLAVALVFTRKRDSNKMSETTK